MAQLDRAALKAFFETGDKPTQAQFANFIDSVVNFIDDNPIKFAKITIPTAQVLTLNSVPTVLVPAQGANKVIKVISASASLIFNSIAYTTPNVLDLQTETSNVVQCTIPRIIVSTITRHGSQEFAAFRTGTTETQLIPNKALLATSSSDPITGNSDITVYLSYKIIDIS